MLRQRLLMVHGLLCLALTAGLLFLTLPVLAAQLVVNTATDENDGSCSDGDCSLRDAIALAANGDTITFAGDYTITLASTLTIARNVTIDGAGHSVTVSGNNAVRVFYVNAGVTFNLQNLTVANGKITGNGGGIENDGTLTIQNSTFSGNTASLLGGGIYNYQGTLNIRDSTFSGNRADTSGGGIYNRGTLTVQYSTFSGNTAFYGGGGILDEGTVWETSTPTIQNSAFSGNSATYGGGIYNYLDILTVQNSTFAGNSAADGGGIYNYGNMLIQNITFSGNSATDGGGIYNHWGNITVQNSTFSGNSASSIAGGIYNTISGTYGTLTVQNSTFSGNSATDGGGIENDGTLNLSDTIIANSPSGGDCYNIGFGSIATNDHNLIEDNSCSPALRGDPLLGSLGNYGGSTQTFPLLPGSPAIDAGNNATCTTTDQRGKSRVGVCDIGAFESQGFTLAKTGGDNQSTAINTAFTNPLVLSVTSVYTEPVDGGQVILTAPSSGASITATPITLTIAAGGASQSVTANSVTGSYSVTASARGATNMNFSLTNDKATATVTLSNLTQTYDGAPKAVSVSTTPSGLTVTVTYDGSATAPTNAGSYAVVATVNDLSYQGSATGTLTINTVPLTITTNDTNKVYGAPLPIFTVVYSGFVHSETETVLSGTLAFDTSATSTSPVGDYAVTPKGLTATNYAITFVSGTLHILAANTATALASSLNPSEYGQAVTFTATVTSTTGTPIGSVQFYADGALFGSPVALSNGAATWLTNMLTVGTHVITATYSGDTNFTASSGALIGGQIVVDTPITNVAASNSSPTRLDDTTVFTVTASGSHVAYTWDFGDNTSTSSGAATSHVYAAAGLYTAHVTATNGVSVVVATAPVTITNLTPIANAGLTQAVLVNTLVTLDGSSSHDPDSHVPLTYHWAQIGGPAMVLSSDTLSQPTFTAPATPAVLTFTLTVSDAHSLGSLPAQVSILVNDQPLNGLNAINDSPHSVGHATLFTATLTNGTNALYQWDFGDGATGASSANATTQHTYPAVGSYTATVTATNGVNVLTATTHVAIERARLYLPMVLRNFVNAPDLIVQRINASGNNVQVVIANIGSAPVTDEFWVDVYLNPGTAPTHVNQTWNQLGSQGLVWGVTINALPALQPGGVLTLTLNDAYYQADLSHVLWPLAVGSAIYAQVDSANANTTYGAVLENHEISGGPYDNILSSVVSASDAANAPSNGTPSATNPNPASTGLPPRP